MKGTLAAVAVIAVSLMVGCGGGGGGGGGPTIGIRGSSLTITTPSILPPTIQGRTYSTTLQATGGTGTLHWTLQLSPGTVGPTGLSIDANSGVLSGTANWLGTAGFVVLVKDDAGGAASKNFDISCGTPLQAGTPPPITWAEFQSGPAGLGGAWTGGIGPITLSIGSGSLPRGLSLSRTDASIVGAPLETGTFPVTLVVSDSVVPPETVSVPLTVTVYPPALRVAQSLPNTMLLNRPFSGTVVATGGVPPYTFAVDTGTFPPGLSPLDPSTGQLSGTPTASGTYGVTVKVTDSASVPASATTTYVIKVTTPLGRNDTPATATPIGNGSISASISPYEDPPSSAPLPADNDYYRLLAQGGQAVHIETNASRNYANNPLDTVLELVDGNGTRLSTCRLPGDTGTSYTSSCINDDIGGTPYVHDSALDFQAPGASNTATTLYAHVFDWWGDARPDLPYSLSVSGAMEPLMISTFTLLPTIVGNTRTYSFIAVGGVPPYSWSVAANSGPLPSGMTFSSSGVLSGTLTAAGTFDFIVQVSDSGGQVAQQSFTYMVAPPLTITTTSLPVATAGTSYSFPITITGGVAPISCALSQGYLDGLTVSFTCTISGIPAYAGSFKGTVTADDSSDFLGVSTTQSLPLSVLPASSLLVTSAIPGGGTTLPVVSVGTNYAGNVRWYYGTPPATLTLTGTLPPGITFNNSNGTFTGIPTTPGTYTFTISAVDSSNPPVSGNGTFTIVVNP